MRVAVTSAISIGIHVAVSGAVLLGSAKTGRSYALQPLDSLDLQIAFPAPQSDNADHDVGGPSVPGPITIDAPDLGSISIPSLPQSGATGQSLSATHLGFVEPARQALLQTLFRPGMADGRPVRRRVWIPYDFTIRNGIGRAR